MKLMLVLCLFTLFLTAGCSVFSPKPEVKPVPIEKPIPKELRRTFFVMGCISGASSLAQYYRIPVEGKAVVNVCKSIYDTNKEVINKQLDELSEKGI